jgi:hypothetical protein
MPHARLRRPRRPDRGAAKRKRDAVLLSGVLAACLSAAKGQRRGAHLSEGGGLGGAIDQMSMLRTSISRSTFSLYPDLTRTNAPAAIPGFLRLSETLRDHVTAANGCGADWQSVMRPVSARNARRTQEPLAWPPASMAALIRAHRAARHACAAITPPSCGSRNTPVSHMIRCR